MSLMKQAKYVSQYYAPSNSVLAHNEYEYKGYLNQGYTLIDEFENYPVRMARNARFIVIVTTEDRDELSFDAKAECVKLYGKKRISAQLTEKFASDVRSGKIEIQTDGSRLYLIALQPLK